MRSNAPMGGKMLHSFVEQFGQYRRIGERALAQMPDDALNRVPAPDANSAAMLVRHISGNLISRFTDFLTTDGEKPWRERDEEFTERHYSRAEMDRRWAEGWRVLEETLAALGDPDLGRTITIRGQPLTVHTALCRSLAHVAYHCGQLVLLARQSSEQTWQWISIPKGKSTAFIPTESRPRDEKGPPGSPTRA